MSNATTAARPIGAADPVSALRDAEQRLFHVHGLDLRERWVELSRLGGRARLLETGAGPPTLHLPGGPCPGAVHAPLAAAMPGRRHLLLDRPGFGLSDPVDMVPDVRGRSVQLLVDVLDALGLSSVDVVGNSMGAGMGLWLAVAHPERVRSLALVGGAAMLPGPPVPFLLRVLAAPVIGRALMALERPSPGQVRRLFQRFGHDPDRSGPEMLDVMLAAERVPAYARAWRELLQATISVRGQRPGLLLTPDELRGIACPVSFAWGEGDPMVRAEDGRAAAAHLADARFEVVGTGHAPWLEAAAAVARAIEPTLAAPAAPPRSPAAASIDA